MTEHLTIRISAGFNAEVMLAGLLSLTDQSSGTATAALKSLFPNTCATVELEKTSVNSIAGTRAKLVVPGQSHGHTHRQLSDIYSFYDKESRLGEGAAEIVERIWNTLAAAEGRVHGTTPERVHFHEVGRDSNILAIALIATFIDRLKLSVSSSPIPVADGVIRCAHGLVPNPAPAMMAMLTGVSVVPFAGTGEPVTPTGLAILLGLGATFGPWPAMRITREALCYGRATFEGVPSGTRFILGELE